VARCRGFADTPVTAAPIDGLVERCESPSYACVRVALSSPSRLRAGIRNADTGECAAPGVVVHFVAAKNEAGERILASPGNVAPVPNDDCVAIDRDLPQGDYAVCVTEAPPRVDAERLPNTARIRLRATVDPRSPDPRCRGRFVATTAHDLVLLSHCTTIDGGLLVTREGLPADVFASNEIVNLDALRRLEQVGPEGLVVRDVAGLVDASALSRLRVVEGDIVLRDLPALASVSGFASLARVRSLSLARLPRLTRLDGFASLESTSLLAFSALDRLEQLGAFPALQRVDTLVASENARLTSLAGLGSIAISESLEVTSNARLRALDFALRDGAAPSEVVIDDNAELVSLEALRTLRTVREFFVVENNPSLRSLRDLDALTSVGEGAAGGHVIVEGNLRLPQCEVDAFVDRLRRANPATTASTGSNDPRATCTAAMRRTP
jgi:hypothetical protein